MKVLILEDDFLLQRELHDRVTEMGHEVYTPTDAEEATEIMQVTEIDAVIADVFVRKSGEYIPKGGLLLLSRVRLGVEAGLRVRANTPVLVISGGRGIPGGFSPLKTARDLGADACLEKPFDLDEVADWLLSVDPSATKHETTLD